MTLRDQYGGALAVLISVLLLVMVLARDVGLNPLNGWTIALCSGGGVVAWRGRGRRPRALAITMIILGALPATLFVGLGLVYVSSIILIATAGVGGVLTHASTATPGDNGPPRDGDH